MSTFQKAGVATIILVETLVFSYVPGVTKKFSNYRGVWLNEKNLDNATSGALLSLALTHLLPEGFGEGGECLKIAYIDVRGFIMGMPILLLVTIDFLAGHHCGGNSVVNAEVKPLKCSSTPIVAGCDLEHNRMHNEHVVLSHLSTNNEHKNGTLGTRIETLGLQMKQLFTSRALYLLLTFYAHSILEGALLGTQQSSGPLWGMGFGIFAHKWAECLVLNTTVTNLVKGQALRNMCTIAFALCVPIGILLGALVKKGSGPLSATFQLLAIGFFLYLSFELLTHQGSEADNTHEFPLWVSYFLGAVIMAMILIVVEVVEHNACDGN